jgi:hypothetical protein
MATTQKIPALNPYVNSTPETDPMISRVPMDDVAIGARASQLRRSFEDGRSDMTIKHVGEKK